MMEPLNQDFREFIGLLEKHGVDYLVIGGYAVALHGFPRYTGDIDFFVAIAESNASNLLKVFEDFGFGDIGLSMEDFMQKDFVVEIGREPRKIQVLTGIDGVHFNECFAQRLEVAVDGLTVKFISKDDLICNKVASGRPKDRIDAEELSKLA
jgi:predicted nucleotidyltransferase